MGPAVPEIDWAQARALLDLAGMLPLDSETFMGVLWMEEGATEVFRQATSH